MIDMNHRYLLAIFTLITVIVIAWILRPNLPVPVLAEPGKCMDAGSNPDAGEARESTSDHHIQSGDSRGGQNLSVSYGTLVMPTPLELPENYYQAQGKVLDWRKHHGFWIP